MWFSRGGLSDKICDGVLMLRAIYILRGEGNGCSKESLDKTTYARRFDVEGEAGEGEGVLGSSKAVCGVSMVTLPS